jgi:hypothetical protein
MISMTSPSIMMLIAPPYRHRYENSDHDKTSNQLLTRLPNVESVSSAGFAPTVAHAMMRFKPMR